MDLFRKFVGVVLAVVPACALAQSPYVISGLHTDLIFTEAVALAEKLGGDCQVSNSRTGVSDKSVQCEYVACGERNQAGACEKEQPATAELLIAAQPILRISLEAPEDSAPLTRIVMVYEGDTAVVAQNLIEEFGPSDVDGTPTDNKSWSNARRWSWTRGRYRMGLLDSPQLIILAVQPPPALPAGETRSGETRSGETRSGETRSGDAQ
jgi:hypothetical protein